MLLIKTSLSVKMLIVDFDGMDNNAKKIAISSALVEDTHYEMPHLNVVSVLVLIHPQPIIASPIKSLREGS